MPCGLSSVCSRNGGDHPEQRGLAHPGRTVGAQVAGHLAGAHREPGEDDVLGQREVVEKRLQVGGERVVVETGRRLARQAEAAAVVADAAVARFEQHAFLALPRVALSG